MKENSINQYLDEKKSLRASAQAIIDGAKAEKRAMTDEESVRMAEIRCQLAELDLKIDEKRSSLRGAIEAPQEKASFSMVRAIRNAIAGVAQGEAEARMLEAGAKFIPSMDGYHGHIQIPIQSRGILTATSGATNGAIDTIGQGVVLPLENNLVLAQAGATIMTGLKGNIAFPTVSKANVAWAAENAQATDQTPTFGTKPLSPKRLTAFFDVSNQLLAQENQAVENYLRQLIANSISEKLEATLLSTGSSVADTPDGLLKTIATKGALSWDNIVKLETTVSAAGGLKGNLAYILHPSLIGKSKSTAKDSSGAGGLMINDNGLLNGYKCFSSANLASGINVATSGTADNNGYGAIFGNWSDLVLGNWNSIGIEVDPFTQNLKGVTRLVVHSWWDATALRDGSFCAGAFKI